MKNTTNVYITDKNNGKHFNTICSSDYAMSEVRNLERKLSQARECSESFHFLDIDTAEVVVDGECGDYLPKALNIEIEGKSDTQLLNELFSRGEWE